ATIEVLMVGLLVRTVCWAMTATPVRRASVAARVVKWPEPLALRVRPRGVTLNGSIKAFDRNVPPTRRSGSVVDRHVVEEELERSVRARGAAGEDRERSGHV